MAAALQQTSAVAQKRDVVVIGGGVAAGYIARVFAEHGGGSRLTVLEGIDPALPYERPALTKGYLHSNVRLPSFNTCVATGGELQDAEWYRAKDIEVIQRAEVSAVNFHEQEIVTSIGVHIQYEHLIIATGSEPRRLNDSAGGSLQGVLTVRREADVAALLSALRPGLRAVVVGGGYIGMEVAAGLAAHPVSVTMVFPEASLMPRLFTPEIAAPYEKLYESRGVTILKGDSIDRILAHPDAEQPRVSGVRLRSGAEIPADLVVVGIGAIPVAGPFRGLEQSQGGILVDDHLRACGPGVAQGSCFAVGDVACFPVPVLGRSERVEHVDHARKSAMHVARALCGGGGGAYHYLPYFYSRVFEERGSPRPVRWVFYGDSPATAAVVVLGDFKPQLAAFWVNGESRLVGVFLESGSPEEVEALPRIARARPTVNARALRGLGVKEALRLVGATQPTKEE